jgi:hypothetical protein
MSPRRVLASVAIALTVAAGLVSVPSAASANPGAPAPAIPAGAILLSTKTGHFTRMSSQANGVTPDTPSTDCSANVSIYRIGSVIYGSAAADCTYNVDTMRVSVGLYRSRWFGWEGVGNPGTVTENNTSFEIANSGYGCAGTGTHNFLASGSAFILYQGDGYYFSDSDEIDNQSC